jgi:uncharacterized RDD family membrane protein YckC
MFTVGGTDWGIQPSLDYFSLPGGGFCCGLNLGSTFFVLTLAAASVGWEVFWLVRPEATKPGQRRLGMRVRCLEANSITLGRAAGRGSARVALYSLPTLFERFSWIPPLALVATAITIAVTGHRQALHDLLTKTVVERDVPPKHPEPLSG